MQYDHIAPAASFIPEEIAPPVDDSGLLQDTRFWRFDEKGQLYGRLAPCQFTAAFSHTNCEFTLHYFKQWHPVEHEGHISDYYTIAGEFKSGTATRIKQAFIERVLNHAERYLQGTRSLFHNQRNCFGRLIKNSTLWDDLLLLAINHACLSRVPTADEVSSPTCPVHVKLWYQVWIAHTSVEPKHIAIRDQALLLLSFIDDLLLRRLYTPVNAFNLKNEASSTVPLNDITNLYASDTSSDGTKQLMHNYHQAQTRVFPMLAEMYATTSVNGGEDETAPMFLSLDDFITMTVSECAKRAQHVQEIVHQFEKGSFCAWMERQPIV